MLERKDPPTADTEMPIAVVGLACWYPDARNPRQLWENVLARRRAFRRMPDCRLPLGDYHDTDRQAPDATYGSRAAVIDGFEFDWAARRIPFRTVESTDVVHWLALEMALAAVADAGYDPSAVPGEKTGVIVGNTLTGEQTRSATMRLRWPFVRRCLNTAAAHCGLDSGSTEALEKAMLTRFKAVFPPTTEDTLAGGLANTIAGRICHYLNLSGGGYVVDGACSSSLLATATAIERLRQHDLDLVLAGGVDISLDPFELVGFARTGALASGEMQVYDRNGRGFIPGEGCGFVVLKRLADARRDGDRVYALILGWGISSDGRGAGITAPSMAGQVRAIRRAFARTPFSPSQLDFIEGHGTATAVGDRTELSAIQQALADDTRTRPRSCGVTSLKSIIGHTKAASGIGGLVKAVMAVNRRIVPPTAGCREPHELFEEACPSIFPVLHGRRHPPERLMHAGVSSMGFGGINCHVTLCSAGPPDPRLAPGLDEEALLASHQESEIFPLAAEAPSGLARQAAEWARTAAGLSQAELIDFAAELSRRMDPAMPWRAALVAHTVEELTTSLEKLALSASSQARTEGTNGIRWGKRRSALRLGMLFPGQGAQQLNMARVLVQRYEWARQMIAAAEKQVGDIDGLPLHRWMFRDPETARDADELSDWRHALARTEIAQPAICLASALWLYGLAQLGLSPAAVGGHSLGEVTALYAAGAFDFDSLMTFAALRGRTMSQTNGRSSGTMIALECDADTVSRLIEQAGGDVIPANRNGPRQIVLSGDATSIERVLAIAAQAGIRGRRLAVSGAFHSPHMAVAAGRLQQEARLPKPMPALHCRMFSTLTGAELPPECDLTDHLCSQITAPVDFAAMLPYLAAAVDLIAEVGPGRVLSGLAAANLPERTRRCLPVESQAGQDRDFNHLLAELWVQGADPNWNVLYERRLVRPFTAPEERNFIVNLCEKPISRDSSPAHSSVSGQDSSETGLAAQAGLSAGQWRDYLNRRRAFLARVIRADLDLDSLPDKSAAEPQIQPAAAPNPMPIETPPGDQPRGDLAARFLGLVHQVTGFAPETISLRARLLDDLNLDSIKAGDLLVRLAREAGVGWPEHPTVLANASLEEILAAVARLKPDSHAQAAAMPQGDIEDPYFGLPGWVRDFRLRRVALQPPAPAAAPAWSDAQVLVVSGQPARPYVDAMEGRLRALGATVKTIRADDPGLRHIMDDSRFTHRIAVMPPEPVPVHLMARELRDMVSLRRTVMAAAYKPNAVAAFVQFGGAVFGRTPAAACPAAAGCLALASSLHLEQPGLRVRVIDLPVDMDPDRAARRCVAELASEETFRIAGYDDHGDREECWTLAAELCHPATYQPRDIEWSDQGVILVSGGAKGITAECAEAAAVATGAQLALLGSTALPDQQVDPDHAVRRTLSKLARKGIQARYYACDIVQPQAVEAIVRQVRAEQGRIRAVIHGAGLNHPRPAATVSAAEALHEISPKVLGLLNLWAALQDDPPGLIVGLSSIIGISGMPGNAWYGYANETMDIALQAIAAACPSIRIQAVAFSIWGETGMGARMGSVTRLAQMGIAAIPSEEGRKRFARLFTHDPGAPTVVVTSRLGGLDTWRAGQSAQPPGRFARDSMRCTPGVEAILKTRLHLSRDLYLKDHEYNGAYLFPTVFGLEAMAQAAAAAAGQSLGLPMTVADICLRRPITVPPGEGAEILIWAQVAESSAGDAPPLIQAGIRKTESGLAEDYFCATFKVGVKAFEDAAGPQGAGASIPIVPAEDLYRDTLLFQGPRFQRIAAVHVLEGNGRDRGHAELDVQCASDNPAAQAFAEAADRPLLLPDPFFTDALLQSAALLVPQDPCLPVAIDRLIFGVPSRLTDEVYRVRVDLEACHDQTFLTRVTAADPTVGAAVQLIGYRLKILKHVAEYPTVDELRAPAERDRRLLAQALTAAAEAFAVAVPEWDLEYIPGIHRLSRQERQWLERPLLERIVERACQRWNHSAGGKQVRWLSSGKPALIGAAGETVDLTLTHDERLCLAAGGPPPQGCDIAPISTRGREDWETLLGERHAPLLDDLMQQGDSLDESGTRLWAALEAAQKAFGPDSVHLQTGRRHHGAVLFNVSQAGKTLAVLTVAVRLTWGLPKMVALTTQASATLPATRSPADYIGAYTDLTCRPAYEACEEEPGGPLIFMQRFPVTFKPGAQLSRNVYFTHYFDWMGHAREASTYPIMRELIDLLGTGRWGSVTNYSRMDILGEARTGDLVQLRMWTSENGGPCNATMTLQYDFMRLAGQGPPERLAFCELQTTWVELTGPGQARPAPYPPVLLTFFENMIPRGRAPQPDASMPVPLEFLRKSNAQLLLYKASPGPIIRPQLAVQTFETALGQANAVGNVYYAKYYEWQGMLRDYYLQRLLPDYFGGTGERGEAVCLACRVDHLREAMPFDRIMVTMALKTWYRDRALFAFDYFRVEEGRSPVKLAWGTHEMVWVERYAGGRPHAAAFPEPLAQALRAAVDRDQPATGMAVG